MCIMRSIINRILKGTTLMANIEDIKENVVALTDTLHSINSKLDEIKAFISTLEAGEVTQSELDELDLLVSGAKDEAVAVLEETDALDDSKSKR